MRTLAEQCAYAMRQYPTPLQNGEKFALALYEQGYYHELVAEYGSQAAQPFAEWLEMHGVEVETVDDEPPPTLAEPEPTLAVTPVAEPKPHDWKQTARSIVNWLRSVDLNKYDAKKLLGCQLITEETVTVSIFDRRKPATKISHGAKPTRHGQNGISHGAKPTRHEPAGISHEQIEYMLELIQQNSQ